MHNTVSFPCIYQLWLLLSWWEPSDSGWDGNSNTLLISISLMIEYWILPPKICHLCFSFWKVFSWMICPFIYCVISSLAKFNDYFLKIFFLRVKKISGPASCKSYQLQRGGSWREESEIAIWAKPAWRPAIWQTSRHMAGREHGNENNLSTSESVLRIWPVSERKRQKGKSTSVGQLHNNCTSEFWENISLTFWRRFLSNSVGCLFVQLFLLQWGRPFKKNHISGVACADSHLISWHMESSESACLYYTSGFPPSSFKDFHLMLGSLINFRMYFCAGWKMWK